jgi:hypothetical protein
MGFSTRLGALIGRPWFWAVFVGALFAGPLLRGLTQGAAPPPPPVLGTFPSFDLRADDGREFAAARLRGRPFIADLLCRDCAAASGRAGAMRNLQHRTRNLGDALWLVSFSDDLDLAALRGLRERHAAGARWMLVSGVPPAAAPLFSGENTVLLVDGQRRIRGRYDAARRDEIDRLLVDAALIAALR